MEKQKIQFIKKAEKKKMNGELHFIFWNYNVAQKINHIS